MPTTMVGIESVKIVCFYGFFLLPFPSCSFFYRDVDAEFQFLFITGYSCYL